MPGICRITVKRDHHFPCAVLIERGLSAVACSRAHRDGVDAVGVAVSRTCVTLTSVARCKRVDVPLPPTSLCVCVVCVGRKWGKKLTSSDHCSDLAAIERHPTVVTWLL